MPNSHKKCCHKYYEKQEERQRSRERGRERALSGHFMGETVKSGQRLKSRMKFQFQLQKNRRKRGEEGAKERSWMSCEEMRIMLNHLSGEICISMKKLQQQRRKAEKATDKQIIGIKWHQKLIKRGGAEKRRVEKREGASRKRRGKQERDEILNNIHF